MSIPIKEMWTCFTMALFTTYMKLLISFCTHWIRLYSYFLRTETFPLEGKKEIVKSENWGSPKSPGCPESQKTPKPLCVFAWVEPVSGRRKLISEWAVGGAFQGHISQEESPIPEWALSYVIVSFESPTLLRTMPISLFCDAYQVILSTWKVCTLIVRINYLFTVNVYQIITSIWKVCILTLHITYVWTMWKSINQ